MKCKSCGANYASRELCCPYCDTPNPRGVLWYRQRAAAMADYQKGMQLLPGLRRVAVNRILNRVLLIEAALFVLLIIGIVAAALLGEWFHQAGSFLRRDGLRAQFDQLYAEERYGELYCRMQEADLMGQEYYEYSQMALLYYDYENFCRSRLEYYKEMEEGELGEYTLDLLISNMHSVLYPYIPAFPELTKRNTAQLEKYRADVDAFGRSVLGFTEKEMNLLAQDYLTVEEEDSLIAAAEERGAVV